MRKISAGLPASHALCLVLCAVALAQQAQAFLAATPHQLFGRSAPQAVSPCSFSTESPLHVSRTVAASPLSARGPKTLKMAETGDQSHPSNSSRDQDRLKVVIIGGGPNGLFAASSLMQLDFVSVTVVEQESEVDMDAGVATAALGMPERLVKHFESLPGNPLGILKSRGSQLLTSGSLFARRDNIRFSLLEELRRLYGNTSRISLRFGTKLVKLDGQNRKMVLSNGQNLDYDILIAADGVHSPTRTLSQSPRFAKAKKYAYPEIWKRGWIPPTERVGPKPFLVKFSHPENLPGKESGFLSPREDGSWVMQLYWDCREGEFPDWSKSPDKTREFFGRLKCYEQSADTDLKQQQLDAVMRSLTDEVIQSIVGSKTHCTWTSVCDHVVDEDMAIVLLGEAAGSLTPVIGQGLAVGADDVRHLKQALTEAQYAGSKKGTIIKDALRQVEPLIQENHTIMRDFSLFWVYWGVDWPIVGKLNIWSKVVRPALRGESSLRKAHGRLLPLFWLCKLLWAFDRVPSMKMREYWENRSSKHLEG